MEDLQAFFHVKIMTQFEELWRSACQSHSKYIIGAILMLRKPFKKNCQECDSRFLGVFCSLDDSALALFNKSKSVNHYKKGHALFHEGNPAFGLYCITSGKVKIFKTSANGRQKIVRIAGPGDLVGYRALFANEPYHASAEIIEEAEICFLNSEEFFYVLNQNPSLSGKLIKKLSQELRQAEDMSASIALKTARERMAELLLILKEAHGETSKNGIKINLELSREEMAEFSGMTQETAIRLLSELKKAKFIDVQERQITILNSSALAQIAGLEI